jgi:flagellar hook-associated protein 1 FlgK
MSSSLINIGISGLRAHQAALATTGHNITNANAEGYTRQVVQISPQTPQFEGAGFLGRGAQLEAVTRVHSAFLTNQVRLDTAAFTEVEDFLSQIGQLDSLLADELTGLVPSLQSFFGSLQAASTDPASIPARQLVLSEVTGLVNRFNTMYGRLNDQQAGLSDQISTATNRISELARGIGRLNARIAEGTSQSEAVPNDLLDQRDELLRKLSEMISVNVVPQSDGQVNVFIGKGQPLIIGGQIGALATTASGEVTLVNGTNRNAQVITESIAGGQLGGLLKFQDGVLNQAQNHLGRIAIAVTEAINAAHHKGVTLDGVFGGDVFTAVNDPNLAYQRVVPINLGSRPSGSLYVGITDSQALTASDYEVRFSLAGDGSFTLVRRSDAKVMAEGTTAQGFPVSVAADGFELRIESGVFQAGDRYRLSPTLHGARDIGQVIQNARDLALATPVGVATALGNRGTAIAQPAGVFDISHPVFANAGVLTPPLLLQFTSPTTYELLDNSDPAAPRALVPPVRNQPYVPGIENLLLPGATGQTRVFSEGTNVGRLPGAAQTVLGQVTANNGYGSEALTLSSLDPASGVVTSTQNLVLGAGSSARTIAAQLSAVPGIKANALTEVDITGIRSNGVGIPLSVVINGQRFSGAALSSLDTFADAINASTALAAAGVRASSDGSRLRLSADLGDDVTIHVAGDPADGIDLTDIQGGSLALDGAGAGQSAQWVGSVARPAGYDFSVGGPYQFGLSVDSDPVANIALTGNYGSGPALIAGLQSAIDASSIGPGRVAVSMNGSGQIVFTSAATGANGSIEISNAQPGSAIDTALGLRNGVVAGIDLNRTVSVGGSVSVLLNANLRLTSSANTVGGNVFIQTPTAARADFGFQIRMTGRPEAGDRFVVDFNSDGVSDNRNALDLVDIQSARLFGTDGTLFDAYADLVEFVGTRTNQARIDRDASQGLLQQSVARRDALSGVNLDEEAANLIRFEQAYNASARVIAVARDTFDILFNLVR